MAVAVGDETTSRRRGRVVNVLLTLLLIHAVSAARDHGRDQDRDDQDRDHGSNQGSNQGSAQGSRRRRSAVDGDDFVLHWRQRRTPGPVREGPPIKPEHFRSVAELNKYLADLNEYYTVLGRPRSVTFRSVQHNTII